ncbi:MAG: MFS transporter [Chloroflexota bacterium]|nr:MFS transporter [Chloroflexota bacterium]
MRLFLLWVIGFAARVTLLAVPPLIPAIHRDLVMDETAVGALGGIPVFVMCVGALAGSLVIARLGARRATVVGLVIVAAAGALRGVGPSLGWLLAMTVVMSAGIALAQLSIPALVAAWEPANVGRATAVYGNGMLFGEIAGAGLTATVLLALVAASWEVALAVWSVVALAVALVVAVGPDAQRGSAGAAWWPDWRDGRVWVAGLTLASASLAYWGGNAHLPDYLTAAGRGSEVPVALASLNGFQLPASILVGAWPALFVARRWPLVASGVVALLSAAALLLGNGALSAVWAGLVGFVAALAFVLALALPPLLAPAGDVHRFSAGVFAIGYAFAFSGALVAGALWDATGSSAMALLPIVVAGALMVVLGSRLNLTYSRP